MFRRSNSPLVYTLIILVLSILRPIRPKVKISLSYPLLRGCLSTALILVKSKSLHYFTLTRSASVVLRALGHNATNSTTCMSGIAELCAFIAYTAQRDTLL